LLIKVKSFLYSYVTFVLIAGCRTPPAPVSAPAGERAFVTDPVSVTLRCEDPIEPCQARGEAVLSSMVSVATAATADADAIAAAAERELAGAGDQARIAVVDEGDGVQLVAISGRWTERVPDPEFPEHKALAELELEDAALAIAEGEVFAAAAHPRPAAAISLALALAEGGVDPLAVAGAGGWAIVRTPDGALHELGALPQLKRRSLYP
jgi:hypothetical protein